MRWARVRGRTATGVGPGLGQAILDALAASGKNLDALTVDDLAPLDQFHGGGKAATERLARLAELTPGTRVLDVGRRAGRAGPDAGGRVRLPGHAGRSDRVVPAKRAELLTERLGLADRLTHRLGQRARPARSTTAAFDVVWTQNSGMQIADKARLYAEFHRVLRPGGRLAIQEPMAGPVQPPIYPLMWARDQRSSFLRRPTEMLAIIEAAGFAMRAWNERRREATDGRPSVPTIQRLVMGDAPRRDPGGRPAQHARGPAGDHGRPLRPSVASVAGDGKVCVPAPDRCGPAGSVRGLSRSVNRDESLTALRDMP